MLRSENRLRNNDDFQQAIQQGKSVANRQVVIYLIPKEGQSQVRVGISVSKRLGKAVARNRIKRLIREGIGSILPQISWKGDLIIIARQPIVDMSYNQVLASLNHCLKKAELLE